MPQLADIDRHRLRPSDQRCPGNHRNQRKQHGADGVRMHQRVQRYAPEQSRGRIAKAIRGPCVRHLVDSQREEQNDERDENLCDVDVQQEGVTENTKAAKAAKKTFSLRSLRSLRSTWTGYGRLAKNARTASAIFGPTTAASSSRVARLTPARLPNVVNNVLRRRAPTPGTWSSSDRRSRIARARR